MRCCRIVNNNRNILTLASKPVCSLLRTIALLRIEIYCMGTLYQSGMPVFFFIAFFAGELFYMDLVFHRWWSILLYRGHRPSFSNPLSLHLSFSLYFPLSPRLCLSTIDMLIDRTLIPSLYISLSLFISFFLPSFLSFFLSLSLFFFSPCILHVVCIAVWRTSWSFSRFLHTRGYTYKYIYIHIYGGYIYRQDIVTERVSHSLLSLSCPLDEVEVDACLSWPSFRIMGSYNIGARGVAALYRSNDATRHWRESRESFFAILKYASMCPARSTDFIPSPSSNIPYLRWINIVIYKFI